jgi:uncharacterized protein YeaO (DUF488 family)
MLFAACRFDRAAHRGAVVDVSRTGRSPFAPSARLLADYRAGRCTWEEYERLYTGEMRALYRARPTLWHALVERAAAQDVTCVCYERGDEATVRCHRRLLARCLAAVAARRELSIR